MNTYLAIVAVALGAALIVQGVVLRAAFRRKLAIVQARHAQAQKDANVKVEHGKRQVGRLQTELSAARLQIRRLGKNAAPAVRDTAAARQALERELDDATASRHSLPVDGFADTQVSAHDTEHGSLLLQ
jgi:septal ring factor EnvC (AmiA/AmiB activator)